jgi:hypothetical protein
MSATPQAMMGSGFMSTALVPAVLVSACALLLLSFNNRIVAVLTRQRALHRELLEDARRAGRSCKGALGTGGSWQSVLEAAKEDPAAAQELYATSEWAVSTERQIRDLRREACLIRAAISALLAAILLFLASGLTLAISTITPAAERPAVCIFLGALAFFALAICLMLTESCLIVAPVVLEEEHLRRIISRSNPASAAHITVFAA